MEFSLGDLTYIGASYDDSSLPLVKPPKQGVRTWFSHLTGWFAAWFYRRRVIEEMALMTDRELADIGLSRSDLSRVFDPHFVVDHVRHRDYLYL